MAIYSVTRLELLKSPDYICRIIKRTKQPGGRTKGAEDSRQPKEGSLPSSGRPVRRDGLAHTHSFIYVCSVCVSVCADYRTQEFYLLKR